MKTFSPTIKKPLALKPNYKLLPYQYHQNFRASSVITNSGFLPSKKFASSTSASFSSKTIKIDQSDQNEEKDESEFYNSYQNDVLLNTNSNYDTIIFDSNRGKSSIFDDSFPKKSNLNSMQMKFEKFGTVTAIVSLPRMIVDQDQANRLKANEQKKKLLEILETDNLNAADILLKISEYTTPYSKLLKLAYEELQYTAVTGHSAEIDELERNSAVDSAKKEIEIQQLTDKLIKLKNECTDLKKSLKKSQNRLETLNNDIVTLNKLAEIHSIEFNNVVVKSARSENIEVNEEIDENEEELIKKEKDHPIHLDDELYKNLWKENTDLLDKIDELQKQLVKTQEKQAVAFHECAQKIIKARRQGNLYNKK